MVSGFFVYIRIIEMKIMKRLLYIFLPLFALIMFCGCTPEDVETLEGSIELSGDQKELVQISPDGGSSYIRFSSLLDWTVEVVGDGSWLQLSQTEGTAGAARIRLDVGRNESSAKRSVVLNLSSYGVAVPVTVEQDAFVPTFELLDSEKEVSAAGATLSVRVMADVQYTFDPGVDWIRVHETKVPFTYEHFFDIDPNPQPEMRSAEIKFTSECGTEVFKVTQRPAGSEKDDWKYEPFMQRSLAMRFTADWCGYCPGMALALEAAESTMNGRLLLLSVHGGDSALESESCAFLLSRFYVSNFPTAAVDARATVPNYSQSSYVTSAVKDVAEETWEAYPAKTGIALASTLSGSELTIDLDVYVKEADEYSLYIFLLEDKIHAWQNGGGVNYEHNDIARLAITPADGDPLIVEEDGSIWHGSYSATVPEECNPDNLRILVCVEKPYGSQTRVKGVEIAEYGRYGDTYLDNCLTAPVGTEAPLELI